uniref:Uncharacterized protein n=1 Tax=Arundo donax TaxID=35708 RepID=A0A0A9APT1_ARUDO
MHDTVYLMHDTMIAMKEVVIKGRLTLFR